jgi:hypothetical protein
MSVARVVFYLLLAGLGYVAAVVAATAISILVMAVQSPSEFPLRDMPELLIGGAFITAIYAFPGFVVAVFLAARLGWRSALTFALAGLANTLFALLLFGVHARGGVAMIGQLLLPCLPGGIAGGLAYWFVAGRFVAAAFDTRAPETPA